jgi:hypothetical protein
MTATVDRDQFWVLRVLRCWLGPDQVEVLEVREGSRGRGNPPPRLASLQLALTLDDPERTTAPPSRPADRRSR